MALQKKVSAGTNKGCSSAWIHCLPQVISQWTHSYIKPLSIIVVLSKRSKSFLHTNWHIPLLYDIPQPSPGILARWLLIGELLLIGFLETNAAVRILARKPMQLWGSLQVSYPAVKILAMIISSSEDPFKDPIEQWGSLPGSSLLWCKYTNLSIFFGVDPFV